MNRAYGLDVETFRAIHVGLHHPFLDPVFFILTWCGDGTVQTIAVFLGLFTKLGRKLFWPLISSLVLGGILGAQGLKHLFPRDRPSQLPFSHPQELIYYNSFPSGHTTSSFALAAVLVWATYRGPYRWWGYGSVALAAFVGLSRIYRGVHWPSDVLGGIFCGALFGTLTYVIWQWVPKWPNINVADRL